MKNLIVLLLLLSIAGGCASQKVWVHPTRSKSQTDKDITECHDLAEGSVLVSSKTGGSLAAAATQGTFRKEQVMIHCMTSRGYSLADRQTLEDERHSLRESGDDLQDAYKNRDYVKALEIANSVIAQHPNAPHGYIGRGNAYFASGKYREALADVNKVLSMNVDAKTAAQAFTIKILCLLELGEPDVALEVINEKVKLNRPNASLYDVRAYVYCNKGDYDRALEDCNKSLALNINSPSPYRTRGLAYLGKLEFEKAMEQFNKALSIDPSYVFAYHGKGETYLKMGRSEEALAEFNKACELGHKASCSQVKQRAGTK
jgi:tetratricopeptide (TPR) repeat protein